MSASDLDVLIELRAKKRKIDDEINVVAQKFPQPGDLVSLFTTGNITTYYVERILGDVSDCTCEYVLRVLPLYKNCQRSATFSEITISPSNKRYQEIKAWGRVLSEEIKQKESERDANKKTIKAYLDNLGAINEELYKKE